MEKGSFMAIEMFVFLGFVGWLVYYQFSTSGRRTDGKPSDTDAKPSEPGSKDQDSAQG